MCPTCSASRPHASKLLPSAGLLGFLNAAVPSKAPVFKMKLPEASQPAASSTAPAGHTPTPPAVDKAAESSQQAAEKASQPAAALPQFLFGAPAPGSSSDQLAAGQESRGAAKGPAYAAAGRFGFAAPPVSLQTSSETCCECAAADFTCMKVQLHRCTALTLLHLPACEVREGSGGCTAGPLSRCSRSGKLRAAVHATLAAHARLGSRC